MLAFLWLGLSAGRNIVWFAMVAYLLAEALASRGDAAAMASGMARDRGFSRPTPCYSSALAIAVVLSLPWVRPLGATGLVAHGGHAGCGGGGNARSRRKSAPQAALHTTGFGQLIWARRSNGLHRSRFEFLSVEQIDCRFASAGSQRRGDPGQVSDRRVAAGPEKPGETGRTRAGFRVMRCADATAAVC